MGALTRAVHRTRNEGSWEISVRMTRVPALSQQEPATEPLLCEQSICGFFNVTTTTITYYKLPSMQATCQVRVEF